jgi:hypothetical protein
MTGLSMGAAVAIAEKIPWDRYSTVIDIGAADGCVPVQIALRHPHLTGGGFDLPPVRAAFEDHIASFGLTDRLGFHAGDFFVDPLPSADVLVGPHPSRLEPGGEASAAPQGLPGLARRRGAHRLREHHRRRTAPTPSACS